ncbi:F-actin-capping protein subunit alpha [Globodera pallida]|nr:F-actin-capping protein subunit alpha [Globodera pallida]
MGATNSTITGLSTPQSTPPSVKSYDDQMEGPLEAFLEVSKKIGGDVATMGAQPSNAQSGKSMPKKGSSPAALPPPPGDLFAAPSSGGGGAGEGRFDRPALFNAINKADEQITTGPSNKNDTDNNIVVASSDTGDGFELLQLLAQPSPNLLDVPELSSSELCGQEAIEPVVKLGSRQRVCANCHCTSTIFACGLYYTLHQHDRPFPKPKVELKDHRIWLIEFHRDNRDINVQTDIKQSLGALPTISIQKTDGCHVYLSKESLGAEIVTCKSSELNVMVPNGDGDFTEFPVSEQFKTTFDAAGNKLKTESLDIV